MSPLCLRHPSGSALSAILTRSPPPSRFAFCIADSSRLLGGPRPGYGTLQRNTEPSCMVREELWVKGSLLASKQSILLSRPLHKSMHFGVPAGGDGVPQPAVARSPVPRVLCAERWAAAAALPLETQPACAGHVQALRLGEGRLGHHQGERRGGGVVSGMGFPACIRRDAACACRIDSGSASLHACRRRCWVRAGEQSPHYVGGISGGGGGFCRD